MAVMHDHRIENEQRAKQKMPKLYCPFGCGGRDVNPNSNGNAECCHLIGHTIDVKERVFERTNDAPWNNEFLQTSGRRREKRLETDVVINPLVKQHLKTGVHWAKLWASARVYRECTEAEAAAWRAKHAHPTDYELEANLAEEDKDVEIARLRRELAALESQPLEQGPEESAAVDPPPFGPPEPGELDDETLELLTAPTK